MLNVSIVIYHAAVAEVRKVVELLRATTIVEQIWIIDNSEIMTEAFMFLPATYIFNNKNVGFGAGHNVALRRSMQTNAKYHLVMNCDVLFDASILTAIMCYMEGHTDVASLMPRVNQDDGSNQYLCKLLPTPVNLIARRFLPSKLTKRINDRFIMKSLVDQERILEAPYLSGCFLFMRLDALREVGIFDERFFMYPEDVDLTRRLNSKYKTIYYPMVQITHHHARASYHSLSLLWVHIVNMCRYFNKWGWIFDRQRRITNKKILNQ